MPRTTIRDGHKVKVNMAVSFPTRVFDTVYRNCTGHPILCIVAVECLRANVAAGKAYIRGWIGKTSPPTTVTAWTGLLTKTNAPDNLCATLTLVVPSNYYYKVSVEKDASGSNVTLTEWTEVELRGQ